MDNSKNVNREIRISMMNVDRMDTVSTLSDKPHKKTARKVRSFLDELSSRSLRESINSKLELALLEMIEAKLEKHGQPYPARTVLMRMRLNPEIKELKNRLLAPSDIELRRVRSLVTSTIGGMISHKHKKSYKPLISRAASAFYQDPSHHHIRLGCFSRGLKNIASEGRCKKIEFIARISEKTIKNYARTVAPDKALAPGRNGAQDLLTVEGFLKQFFDIDTLK